MPQAYTPSSPAAEQPLPPQRARIVRLPTPAVEPVGANMVFARLGPDQHRRLQAAGARYYVWQAGDAAADAPLTARLVCSFATTAEDVDRFLDALRG